MLLIEPEKNGNMRNSNLREESVLVASVFVRLFDVVAIVSYSLGWRPSITASYSLGRKYRERNLLLTKSDKGKFMRMTMANAMALAASIMISAGNDYQKMQQLSEINYYSRGKSGKKPRTFSGVARARREAKKARNKAA